jgi:hypothetical protein
MDFGVTMKLSKVFFLCCLLPFMVNAGQNDYVGEVDTIKADGGKIFITLKNGSPSSTCGTGNSFYLDPTNDYDKSILSLAITAKATNNDVYALGGGVCESAWPYKSRLKLVTFVLKST